MIICWNRGTCLDLSRADEARLVALGGEGGGGGVCVSLRPYTLKTVGLYSFLLHRSTHSLSVSLSCVVVTLQ